MIVGNDISSFQGKVDFDVYKNNSNFIIFKDTEGIGFQDPQFTRNQSEARRVGLPIGYYHFARPDLGNSATYEAVAFITSIDVLQEGEILALDFEVGFANPVAWCKEFLDTCLKMTGVHPLIYLNKTEVRTYDWTPIAEAAYGLWLACYDNNLITGAWKLVALQQWTNKETVPGIQGNVDGDYFFGTVEQFKLYGYQKPVTIPPIVPSASLSPSSSVSPSISPSSSVSASISPSASPSPSSVDTNQLLAELMPIIFDQWNWFGVKGWYNQLGKLRKIIQNH